MWERSIEQVGCVVIKIGGKGFYAFPPSLKEEVEV